MIGPFQFEDGGRAYACTVEERRTAPMGKWWWFEVSGDGQRYAPFEAETKDTQTSVKSRVIAFYNARLERLAQPVVPRQHWARRDKPAAPVAPKET
jgi:hypothetical protein